MKFDDNQNKVTVYYTDTGKQEDREEGTDLIFRLKTVPDNTHSQVEILKP